MKIYIQNKGNLTLKKNDFIGSGGQGSVYVKGNICYKIYSDPAKMIDISKIKELSVLNESNIIRPLDAIYDYNNSPIGYTMKYIQDCYTLCQLFPRIFKQKNNLTPSKIFSLIEIFKNTVFYIHKQNILIVDLNELNFLIDKKFNNIYFIDIDNYQTKNYKADVIMESIRDRHSKQFTTLTDWFSWAIITFQLFTGIHPYKGKHNTLKNLNDRMLNNISVLNKDVKIPPTCMSFKIIPDKYYKWYYDIFEKGRRTPPPVNEKIAITFIPKINILKNDNTILIQELIKFDKHILSYKNIFGNDLLVFQSQIIYNKKKYNIPIKDSTGKIVITTKYSNIIYAWTQNEKLKLYNLSTSDIIETNIHVENLLEIDNRLYIKSLTNIFEIELLETNTKIITVPHILTTVMEKSTKFYSNVIITQMLNCYYIYLIPKTGECYQIKISELEKYRIIDAKYKNQVLMIIGYFDGIYDKLIFRFDKNFNSYDLRKNKNIQNFDLNFTVLNNGITIHYNNNDEIEIFINKKGYNDINKIQASSISETILTNNGIEVLGINYNNLYKISMKN